MTNRMTRRLALTSIAALVPSLAAADTLSDLLGQIVKNGGTTSGVGGSTSFTKGEADTALREALTIGAGKVITRLSAVDGYFADPKVHIPLPKSLKSAQSTMSMLGMSKPLDELELKINRGAETAAPKAKVLLVNAIKSVTVEDAIAIVRGGNTSATDYLKGRTFPALTTTFTPPMQSALTSVGALKAADKASKSAAKYGYNKDLRGEIVNYAVSSALNGMFFYLGEEEKAIRSDPVNRTTSILKKVFGAV